MDSLEKYCERKKIIKKIFQNGLAKTGHLYKHIRKSPHKYLYFPEEARDIVRPNMVGAPVSPLKSPSINYFDINL